MKTVICYFSGTGNTKKVVDRFAEEFVANGWEVSLFRVEDKCKIVTNLKSCKICLTRQKMNYKIVIKMLLKL